MTTLADDLMPDHLRRWWRPVASPASAPYGGRHRTIPDRNCFAAIVHMARTSTPWRLLPARELGRGSATTCWRRLTEWVEAGVPLGSAATAGGSSAPGRGWAASSGRGSATSASLSGVGPGHAGLLGHLLQHPPAATVVSVRTVGRAARPERRMPGAHQHPDRHRATRAALDGLGHGGGTYRLQPRTPDTMACRIADSWNTTVSRRRVGGCPPDTGFPSDVARRWHGRWHDPVSSYRSGP